MKRNEDDVYNNKEKIHSRVDFGSNKGEGDNIKEDQSENRLRRVKVKKKMKNEDDSIVKAVPSDHHVWHLHQVHCQQKIPKEYKIMNQFDHTD